MRSSTGSGARRLLAPARARRAALEERVAVGVEQPAAVGGQAQRVVLDSAVHGAEQREHAVPGGGRALQRILAVAVGALLQLRAQRARRQRLVVARIVDRQQPPLLGDEQEHQSHHHRDRAAVDLGALEVLQQLAVAVAVLAVERRDQQLDGAADLRAELVGDLLLAAGALLQQRRQPLLDRQREEPAGAEQRDERAQRDRLLQPQLGAPRAGAGALARARPHERPALRRR